MTDQAREHKLGDLYRRTNVWEMFSSTVRTYDFLNHLFSMNIDRLWRRRLIRLLDLPVNGELLDVCTGTGDVAIAVAKKRRALKIVGVDFSQEMLYGARRKIDAAGAGARVELLLADATNLPFADNRFDAATVAFGLRNLTDRSAGISEMTRVVKSGGRVAILEFTPPPDGLFGSLYDWYMRKVMAPVGARISGYWKMYGYLYSSITHFLRPRELEDRMRAAGLRHVTSRRLSGGIAYIHLGVKAQPAPTV